MQFAYTTILNARRSGWWPAPTKPERYEVYKHALEMGFEGIEWSPRWCDLYGLPDVTIAALGEEVTSSGLRVSAINLNRFMLSRCDEACTHQERFFHCVQIAGLLGAGAVIISLSLPQASSASRAPLLGYTIPDAEFAEAANIVKCAAKQAGEHDVSVVLELHDDGMLDSSDQCLRMLGLIDEPNVSLNPDLGNLIRQRKPQETWRDALLRLAPHAGYWHVKNYRNGDPTPIWDGDIDYSQALVAMRQTGYDGWVSIESYFGEDVLTLQAESLNWLRETISRATT